MDNNNITQVFNHYIDKFQMINNSEHAEYYKWQICYKFRELMDIALDTPVDDFANALYKVKVVSANIIDSYTQPFYGLVKFAAEEPETVRQMFLDLYVPDNGDLTIRMKKIETFFEKSNDLLEKYYPGSYLYKQNSHSVSSYLFLYDPENHYMYKATECKTMANCIGFYDDWGTGDNIKLDVFYRMCDEMLAEINNCSVLLKTNESRFDGSLKLREGEFHPDINKHILLFDIIYCCQTYNFFGFISFKKPSIKEKNIFLECQKKAMQLKDSYDEIKVKADLLEEALDCFTNMIQQGDKVVHKKYGEGTIHQINRSHIYICFEPETKPKCFSLSAVIANGILKCDKPDFDDKTQKYKQVLSKNQSIPEALDYAARALEAYEEYLV